MQFVYSVLTSERNPHAALRCLHNMMSLSRQEFLRSSEPLRLPLVAAAAATTATATACIAAADLSYCYCSCNELALECWSDNRTLESAETMAHAS